MSKSISFFKNGADIPGVREYQSSRHPYTVSLDKPPALGDAEALIKSTVNDALKDRVKPALLDNHIDIVDKFFRVQCSAEAIQLWSDLSWRCKKICVESCVTAAGFTLLILQGLPLTITVVLFVGTVVACCYVGWSLQRQHLAEKELLASQNAGEDFAHRRKTILELPLKEISDQKSHFHPDQPGGVLLGVEIFYLFTQNFEPFAQLLLQTKPTTDDQKHLWVVNFLSENPLMINFFERNPHLIKEKEWKAVKDFYDEILKLKYTRDFLLRIEKKEIPPSLKAGYEAAAAKARIELNIDISTAVRYKQMVLQALDEEYVPKISELVEKHQLKMSRFCPFFYPQVRKMLEQAHQQFVEKEPCELEAFDFHSLDLALKDYNAILDQDPRNAYENAKYLSADDLYQKFLAKVFKV